MTNQPSLPWTVACPRNPHRAHLTVGSPTDVPCQGLAHFLAHFYLPHVLSGVSKGPRGAGRLRISWNTWRMQIPGPHSGEPHLVDLRLGVGPGNSHLKTSRLVWCWGVSTAPRDARCARATWGTEPAPALTLLVTRAGGAPQGIMLMCSRI